MKKVLLFLWQLPQMFLGLVLKFFLKATEEVWTDGKREIIWNRFEQGGWFSRFISGGAIGIILLPFRSDLDDVVPHENGHCKQSEYTGPFYLIVVGIYSAVFCNLWDRWFHAGWCLYDRLYWYYKTRWTERWADRLGGVDRDAYLARIPRPANAKYPPMENQTEAA